MHIECKGIKTDTFFIPSFELNDGDIIVICLFNGSHSQDAEILLTDIFCGNTKHENVLINKKMTFVEHIVEPKLRSMFYPGTVGKYLKVNAVFDSPYARRIYEIDWINEKTKLNTLARNPRRLLSLYATLSKTSNIIFDIIGQDPKGIRETFEIVKTEVKNGGSAIMFDYFENLRGTCEKYIELQWIER